MYLNALRMRLFFIGAGVVSLLVFLLAGGSLVPGAKSTIAIEFGMDPDEFEGLEVYIDDESVGELHRAGQLFRTRFAVEDGKHQVRVEHPTYRCRPARVTSGSGGRTVLLLLDFASEYDETTRESETILVLDM